MTDSGVDTKIAAGVMQIWLNRPERRNAFDAGIIAELTQALATARDTPEVRLVLLRGEGAHFSAGADLGWMKSTAQMSAEANRQDAQALAELLYRLDDLPKPTLVCVQGAVYGGAVGLVAACDIALAIPHTRFCLSEVRLGLAPAVISPFVVRAIGQRQARRYCLSAEEFPAEDALALGMIHEIIEPDIFEERLAQVIHTLLQNGPEAMAACKAILHQVAHETDPQQLRNYTADQIARLRTGAEGQEGLAAFFEKRAPHWRTSKG